MIVFGPVPSRRLGRSLGINNIPYKNCSYSCVYCQLGPSTGLALNRRPFFQPEEIYASVLKQLEHAREYDEKIDYLTFVADGEPTLDANLGKTIVLLQNTGIKTAVISNASLIANETVRADLAHADWVSLKVDTVTEQTWRRLNIPCPQLVLNDILQGIKDFAQFYHGYLVTETMLIKATNDQPESLNQLAAFLAQLQAAKTYLSIPIRPPARSWVQAPEPETVTLTFQLLNEQLHNVELLIGSEGENFAFTGNVTQDLLNITSVHPMTEAAVKEFLRKSDAGWQVVQELVDGERLREIEFQGSKFYLRNWRTKQ